LKTSWKKLRMHVRAAHPIQARMLDEYCGQTLYVLRHLEEEGEEE
jgi:hypothetical protein